MGTEGIPLCHSVVQRLCKDLALTWHHACWRLPLSVSGRGVGDSENSASAFFDTTFKAQSAADHNGVSDTQARTRDGPGQVPFLRPGPGARGLGPGLGPGGPGLGPGRVRPGYSTASPCESAEGRKPSESSWGQVWGFGARVWGGVWGSGLGAWVLGAGANSHQGLGFGRVGESASGPAARISHTRSVSAAYSASAVHAHLSGFRV